MTSSASGASTLDIREGDLVKATHRDHPELVVTGRVKSTPGALVNWVYIPQVGNLYEKSWDFEVLERPKPEIPDDLLLGATRAYIEARHLGPASDFELRTYAEGISASIYFINEYHNKKGINA